MILKRGSVEQRVAVLKRRVDRLLREIERLQREQAEQETPDERRRKFVVIKGGRVAVAATALWLADKLRREITAYSAPIVLTAGATTVGAAGTLAVQQDVAEAEARPNISSTYPADEADDLVWDDPRVIYVTPEPTPLPEPSPSPSTLFEVSEELFTLEPLPTLEPTVEPDPITTDEPVAAVEPIPTPTPTPTANPCAIELTRVCVNLPDKSKGGR